MHETISAAILRDRIEDSALAFRGYETENLGRSKELVEHPRYGPLVRQVLLEATREYQEATGMNLDLVGHIGAGPREVVRDLTRDNAVILAMEVAQLRLLQEFFDVPVERARLSFGFSTGELGALVFGKTFSVEQMLGMVIPLAEDCAELAEEARLGILFTRRSRLRPADVDWVCRVVRSEGKSLIGPTTYLSHRAALLVGGGDALARFGEIMGDFLPSDAILKRKQESWTPLHSPLVWKRHIPNRIAVTLHQIHGRLRVPSPPVVSCVTGKVSYDEFNSRELLTLWVDQPQRLWEVLNTTLASGVRIVIHVGPTSKVLPGAFAALCTAVRSTRAGRLACRIGDRLLPAVRRMTGTARVLPSQLALLGASSLIHVSLEDWLLSHEP